MINVIRCVHGAVSPDEHSMRPCKPALAPPIYNCSVSVKDRDWRRSSIQDDNLVLRVDTYVANIADWKGPVR